MPELSPRLKVNMLEVLGNRGCQLRFQNGINIIKGENSLGKTTALKLIQYAFSTKTMTFVKEIDECDVVRLNVSLTDTQYEFKRSLHEGKTKTSLRVFGSGYTEVKAKNTSKFVLVTLNIPLYYVPQHGHQQINKEFVSFSDLFGLMYVPQGVGGAGIQEKVSSREEKRMQRAVFETLLKLFGVNLLELELQKSQLEQEKQELDNEIKTYKKLLQELNIPAKGEIEQKIETLQKARIARAQEREQLLQAKRGDPAIPSHLNQEIIQLDSDVKTLSEEISFLEERIGEYRDSLHDVINEQHRLKRYGTSKDVLSSFSFVHCPRCSQPIEADMKGREAQNECMLCGREIQPEHPVDLLKQLDDLEDEAKELNQLISRYESEIATKKAMRETWLQEKAIKDRALDEQMQQHYTSAFISNNGPFRDFESVKLDRESYMPFINGLAYNRFSTVQTNLAVLGYHYALLRYSLNHESNYPRFLMIDTPNKGDMGEDTYEKMMRKFGALCDEKESFQLIIATREIPDDMQRDNLFQLEDYLLQEQLFSLL